MGLAKENAAIEPVAVLRIIQSCGKTIDFQARPATTAARSQPNATNNITAAIGMMIQRRSIPALAVTEFDDVLETHGNSGC